MNYPLPSSETVGQSCASVISGLPGVRGPKFQAFHNDSYSLNDQEVKNSEVYLLFRWVVSATAEWCSRWCRPQSRAAWGRGPAARSARGRETLPWSTQPEMYEVLAVELEFEDLEPWVNNAWLQPEKARSWGGAEWTNLGCRNKNLRNKNNARMLPDPGLGAVSFGLGTNKSVGTNRGHNQRSLAMDTEICKWLCPPYEGFDSDKTSPFTCVGNFSEV